MRFLKILPLSFILFTVALVRADGPSVGGFVDFGYNYNFNKQTTNVFRSFDANANSFTLQDGKVAVSGTTKDNISYRVDVIYGYDASVIHSAGFITSSTGTANAQVDLEQAYVSYPCPWTGGTWTVGKFVTLHGAEVIEAKDNFNISRGLLFNYAIPFTHTGIKYEKVWGPLDAVAGIVNGWDNLQDNNKGKSFHGMATYTFNPKIKASVGGTYGPEQPAPAPAGNNRSLVDALITYTPTDKLTLDANYDWGVEEGLNATNSGFTPAGSNKTADWMGIAVHANYAFTDKNSVAFRYENFADDGSRTAAAPSVDANGKPLQPIVLDSLTLTLQHKLSAGVITRLEYREDMSNKDAFTDSHGITAKTKTQSTVGAQVICTF